MGPRTVRGGGFPTEGVQQTGTPFAARAPWGPTKEGGRPPCAPPRLGLRGGVSRMGRPRAELSPGLGLRRVLCVPGELTETAMPSPAAGLPSSGSLAPGPGTQALAQPVNPRRSSTARPLPPHPQCGAHPGTGQAAIPPEPLARSRTTHGCGCGETQRPPASPCGDRHVLGEPAGPGQQRGQRWRLGAFWGN